MNILQHATTRVAIAVSALGLLGAACGSGTEGPTEAANASQEQVVATTTTAAPTTTAAAAATTTPTTTTVPLPPTTAAPTTSTTTETVGGGGTTASAANPVVLAAVANADVATVRAEMFMHMVMNVEGLEFEFGGDGVAFAQLLSSGDRFHMAVDMAAVFGGEMLAELGLTDGDGLGMETVGDADVVYLRAPMFASPLFAEEDGAEIFAELGDGWGVIHVADLEAAFGELLPTDVTSAVTGQDTQSIQQWLDMAAMMRSIDADGVGAPSSVRGVPTTRYTGVLTFDDLLELGGMGGDTFDQLLATSGGPEAEAVAEAFETFDLEMSVHIDDDGYPRAINMTLDFGQMFDSLGDMMGETPPDDLEMVITTSVEFIEFSDEFVDIEFPADSEVTADIGQAMLDLLS